MHLQKFCLTFGVHSIVGGFWFAFLLLGNSERYVVMIGSMARILLHGQFQKLNAHIRYLFADLGYFYGRFAHAAVQPVFEQTQKSVIHENKIVVYSRGGAVGIKFCHN